MRRRELVFTFLAGAVALGPARLFGQGQRQLRIAFIRFEPQYISEGGRATGEVIEDFRLVLAHAGYEGVFAEVPVPELPAAMGSGRFDATVINVGVSGAREGFTLVSKESIGLIELMAFYRRATPPLAHFEELRGRRVALMQGFGYGGRRRFIDDPANGVIVALETATIPTGIAALRAGKADYFLQYQRNVEHAMKGDDLSDLRWSLIDVLPIQIIVAKSNPRAAEILKELETSLLALRHAGKLPMINLPQ